MTLLIGTGEMIHGQMLRMGERLYGDEKIGMQYSFLRAEPEKPSCDRHPNIEAQVQEQMKQMLLMSLQVCLVQHLNQMYALLY